MRKVHVIVGLVAVVLIASGIGLAGADENGKTKLQDVPKGIDGSATRAVVMQTIYDDGDGASDTFVNPPPTTTGTYQDNWIGVKGGITGATVLPFSIETVAVFMRHTWNVTVAVWKAGTLSTRAASAGTGTGVVGGFNTFTFTTPVVITNTTASNTQWYMAAWQSYNATNPTLECTTCRVIGVDTAGVAFSGVGFHSDNEINSTILVPQALAPNSVPIVRAGVNTNATTVPVELLEFIIE